MERISLVVKTYSDVDINVYGIHSYIQDDMFEIMLIAYAIDDNPVEIIDLSKNEEIPSKLRQAILDRNVCKYTFDSNYERWSIAKGVFENKKLLRKGWVSVFSILKCFGLPKDLEEIAELYNLPKPKCDYIHKYDNYFSTPMRAADIKKRVMPDEYPVIWRNIKEYMKWQADTIRNIVNKTQEYYKTHCLNIFRWAIEYELLDNTISDRAIHIHASKLKEMTLSGECKLEANTMYLRLNRFNYYNATGNNSNEKIDILTQVIVSKQGENLILYNFKKFKDYILGWIVGEEFSNEAIAPSTVAYMYERISRAIEYVVEFKEHIKIGRLKIYWRDGSVWIKVNNKVRLVYMNLTLSKTLAGVGFTYISQNDNCVSKSTTSSERIYTDIISAVIGDLIYMVARELTMNSYIVYSVSEEKLLLSCPYNSMDNMQNIVNYACMHYLK